MSYKLLMQSADFMRKIECQIEHPYDPQECRELAVKLKAFAESIKCQECNGCGGELDGMSWGSCSYCWGSGIKK